ncbi:geranylgeranyl diphosphate synthase type II [Cytobacillus eiseniae]|uniref:Geranylgeranyl diphosphate synthase type II n=1 Tax=Cytobacillus eiseniae TaxID=762947 RepID=A0ABS4RD45_9BACI|nr:farnesyl diphosphate synthase [Cytobacillus eiseniae]MBP2240819.1 geranylgeranyl diphosphate synthase type II [Cytobacillus eiseniae]
MQPKIFASFASTHKQLLEEELRERVNKLVAPSVVKEAMLYSLEAGGKRIRPLLLFATLDAFGLDTKKGLLPAAAIEMIHTYSLIHDDLPSMDNDDLRRGKPTNHKVFGDAFAILAGDALLTYSFQLIAEIRDEDAHATTKLALIQALSQASGAEGMVGGQVADIAGEDKDLTLSDLEYIHVHKTGKLLECSVVAGAILAEATEEKIQRLSKFAYHLGLAFQIRDDILDLEGEEERIGKRVGSDAVNKKGTYPSILTLDGAKAALSEHIELAKAQLKETGLSTHMLEAITNLIETRDH